MAPPFTLSKDNIEQQFAVNHLGMLHYVGVINTSFNLQYRMLPRLQPNTLSSRLYHVVKTSSLASADFLFYVVRCNISEHYTCQGKNTICIRIIKKYITSISILQSTPFNFCTFHEEVRPEFYIVAFKEKKHFT